MNPHIGAATSLSEFRESDRFDLLIVGGGIVGAGVARDAAMRGLSVCLVDQQDFAAGTSSRSSRLLHGGIRYLAQLNLKLVRESSREKMVLHQIAPHLAQPLPFIFPTRKKSGWGLWKLGAGVKLYDLLCGGRNLGASTILSARQTLTLLPGLRDEGLTGAVRYFDGLTNDSRLTIDTLRSARSRGAVLKNYVRFIEADRRKDCWVCQLNPAESQEHFQLEATCIVNAAGPWSDRIPGSKTELRLTKGVHLVIDRTRLPVPDAVVFAERDRILFAIPWGERVILGTTDTDYNGPVETPTCDPDDRQYILDVVNEAFPSATLSGQDVLSTWAGLRPLVSDRYGRPSDISRRHAISMSSPGWWDVSGGKLTSYRLMAEETVDRVVRFLGKKSWNCRTDQEPLLPDESPLESSILPPPVSRELVEHYCHQEWARHLDDVMVRRTSWRYYHADHGAIAQQAAEWMSHVFHWSEQELRKELDHYSDQTNFKTSPRHKNDLSTGNSSRSENVT